jgi:hypothetical protein
VVGGTWRIARQPTRYKLPAEADAEQKLGDWIVCAGADGEGEEEGRECQSGWTKDSALSRTERTCPQSGPMKHCEDTVHCVLSCYKTSFKLVCPDPRGSG